MWIGYGAALQALEIDGEMGRITPSNRENTKHGREQDQTHRSERRDGFSTASKARRSGRTASRFSNSCAKSPAWNRKCGAPASLASAVTTINTPVGREGDSFLTGFSPRKQNLTLYIMAGFDEYKSLMGKLGKHKTGKFLPVHQQARRRGHGDAQTTGEVIRRPHG